MGLACSLAQVIGLACSLSHLGVQLCRRNIHLAGSVRVITIPIRAVLVQVVSVLKQFSRIKQGEPFSSALAAQGLAREVFSSALAVGETMAAISSAERFLC